MAARPNSTPDGGTTSQYHHYIPRFILRNFSHPFKPPKLPKGQKPNGKRKGKKGPYRGDPMLYTIDMDSPSAQISESPVSTTFGKTDMYRDFENAPNQHIIEQKLSRLESDAARIIKKIRDAHEGWKQQVWVPRSERDTLRIFLFIMKYRGSRAHQRFYHQNAKDYSEDDQERLRKYMRDKGYKRPVDVWFDNITVLLDLKMDSEGKWMADLLERMYPDDAKWAISHMQGMYLAICTPSDESDEFLLTENAYAIHEGPVSTIRNLETGEVREPYTEFHIFGIISPRLILVLRSFLLPVPEEDADPEIKAWRQEMYAQNASQHSDPSRANSTLEDLPVSKSRNSYTDVVDGKLVLKDGEDGTARPHHKFCFRFFPISAIHVNKINSIMLEESSTISTIAFKTKSSARKALGFYLTTVNSYSKTLLKFEGVAGTPESDARLACLKKLEIAAKQLGSDATATDPVQEAEKKLESLSQKIDEHFSNVEPPEFMKLYMKLGGSPRTVLNDMDQAKKMLNVRIKIDVWSKGTEESVREEIRENLRDLFCELAPQRVWYYVKYIRSMLLRGRDKELNEDVMHGPEDVVAKASQIFRTKKDLCRQMYFATINQVHLIKTPEFDLKGEIRLTAEGARRLLSTMKIAFSPSGSICDCGITVLESRAQFHRHNVRRVGLPEENRHPFWKEDQNMEMAVRFMVRREFVKIMRERGLGGLDLKALDGVLFDVIYPTWEV
ncbi:hypothetical protein FQN54_009281 [Arachnomyces sp. PD_36]|nr:hypothetical protein FQN54_009281 [Arachnomyces sp. PD_36]